jgi:CDP-diacylglycerol--serine O-phosphatidyltransferase
MQLIRQIPNILTLTNLFLGCLAIVYMFYDHMLIIDSQRTTYIDMGKLHISAYLVMIAAVIDFLDGGVARLLRAQSPLGKQLDSLADMVTFGLVPGLTMYLLLARGYYASADAFDYPILYYSAGFLLTICAAIRLGRFNNQEESSGFKGLPSPAMALFIMSLPLLILQGSQPIGQWLDNKWVLLAITLFMSFMMTSNTPMISLKWQTGGTSSNKWIIGLVIMLVITGTVILLISRNAFILLPVLIIAYLIISIIKNLVENGI